MNTMNEFPIGSRVILKDLSATEFNGKVGTVKSKLNENGRQQVQLGAGGTAAGDKVLGLKPANLELEPRPLDSLSTREMKTVLSRKDYKGSLAGFDKADLRSLVEAHVTCPNEIASILSKPQDNQESSTNGGSGGGKKSSNKHRKNNHYHNGNVNGNPINVRQQMQNQAAQLAQMSPEQMRQQAQMLRTMLPSQLRRMNPAMANLSDAQIQMAASQMEAMANNPQMVQGMVQQMNNMDDSQLENMSRMQNGNGNGNTPNAAAMPTTTSGTNMSMADMSPDQLRQQAAMMKSMSKDTLRSMNPVMANWPDSQIDMAISQMESMANNPELSKTVMEQMKKMKPEEIEKLQKLAQTGGIGNDADNNSNAFFDPTSMANNKDPMEMLKNSNPAQIKQMLQMVKDNPTLFKEMMRSANPNMADNLTDEQISKTMESFANMDEKKLGYIMGALAFLQKMRDFVKRRGLLILVLFICLCMLLLVGFVASSTKNNGNDGVGIGVKETILEDSLMVMPEMEIEEDEF